MITAKLRAKESAPKSSKVLVMRTCAADGTSWKGSFKWPKSGVVEAADWRPTKECGHGLHGLLWGRGDGALLDFDASSIWQIVEVDEASIVDLGGKVKFPKCVVVFSGKRYDAVEYLMKRVAVNEGIVSGTATAGDRGTATAGYGGTATAGYGGTATAGDSGTATAGDSGTATAGDRGTATAGYGGTATAGDSGTATAGYGGTATAGDRGTATAGDRGTATAGDSGEIRIRRWDVAAGRYRTVIGYVGEDGIEAGVKYKLDDAGKFVVAK